MSSTASSRPFLTHGKKVFFSGIATSEHPGDIRKQTRAVLEALNVRLEEAGTDRRSLLTVHIWLHDMGLFQDMTAVWNDWVGSIAPPSRSCVSGGSLQPGALIEVVASAAIPGPDSDLNDNPNDDAIERYGIVQGEGRPTMCLGLAHQDWFTVCTLASDCSEGISGQTSQILQVFDSFLEQAGTDRSKLLTMDIWIKRISDAPAVQEVLQAWLPSQALPSGSYVRADMARPEMLIEIRVSAFR